MRTTSTFNIMGNIIQLPTYLGVYKIFQNCKAGHHTNKLLVEVSWLPPSALSLIYVYCCHMGFPYGENAKKK